MFNVLIALLSVSAASGWTARRLAPLPAPAVVRPPQTYSTATHRMMDVRTTRDVEWAATLNAHNASLLQYNYAVFFDAGSSGTRMYIYHWNEVMNNTGLVTPQNDARNCSTRLSDFRDEPERVGPSLKACFDFAAQSIPADKHTATRVRLGATAGMRIVATENATAANGVLTAIYQYLRANYNFSVTEGDIHILPAEDETAYVWAAVNYAAKVLQDPLERNNTWTSLYMGGASTDVSMDVSKRDSTATAGLAADYSLTLFDHTFPLFIKNFICYGKDQAFLRYQALLVKSSNFVSPVYNPCGAWNHTIIVRHKDLFNAACSTVRVPEELTSQESYEIIGTADFQGCRNMTRRLFMLDFALQPAQCPFNDAGTCPLVTGGGHIFYGRLLASGGFAYDASTLSLLSNRTFVVSVPFDIDGQRRALHELCSTRYVDVMDMAYSANVKAEFALRACFDGVYSGTMLSDVYRLDDETLKNSVFSRSVNDEDVSWTLGWALITSVTKNTTVTSPNSAGVLRAVSLSAVSFLVFVPFLFSFVIHLQF
ncbi:ectonucleoside triphosphate diphosphohydrolase 1-like [Paramacrobiotus metropolitanus]|uniref:ectonucleoside triphosphate diphosphohydrolase 1-like n=1 Tax=Paramacrobiotus metropolitanus TaxID=2943436 RepID=UPI0024462188|nr:ectonucleoside triphosphate diphosphohydrolase 1-like [Paramacrobiotus metropolitanus]